MTVTTYKNVWSCDAKTKSYDNAALNRAGNFCITVLEYTYRTLMAVFHINYKIRILNHIVLCCDYIAVYCN